jgi:hypothetical protein
MQVERTSAGLAAAMFEELEALRSGSSTPQQARAKASIANTICAISRLEMDYARFVADERTEEEKSRLRSLPMGAIEHVPA